ncbi:MAG: FIST N-terminal domain-containing protein [Planctomycetota bacterium]
MNRPLLIGFSVACLFVVSFVLEVSAEEETRHVPLARPDGELVMRVVMVEDEQGEPVAAGEAAANSLRKAMNGTPLKAVIISECFEGKAYKEKLLAGLSNVLDPDLLYGAATYGSFTQQGCTDFDSVCLLGIGGAGVGVSTALVTELGTAKLSFDEHEAEIKQKLHEAGKTLGGKIRRHTRDRLLILIPDAHSPKNRYFVEGVQQTVGADFPMTGGSANKNAGQTFVYFRGRMYQDSAIALMLSGNFQVSLSGRMAQENDAVIRTAREAAAEALDETTRQPLAVLAYNCAGRRGRLDNMDDELVAIQEAIGKNVPLFGCYNAGEIGPLDPTEKQSDARCGGSGWHVMFTMIWQD